jgi:glutathione S-transferase
MGMADFELYCFGESGYSFKVAFMLQAAELSWKPHFVDFFNGETRSDDFRKNLNVMGEAPVLVHGSKMLTQSGVILDYLAEVSRKFGPKSDDERREIMRWMLFDNHKLSSSVGALRYMISIAKTGETPVTDWLRGRSNGALKVLDAHLTQHAYIIGKRPTIADFSLCGYLYYGDELPFDLNQYAHVQNWLDRLRDIKGWKHPYDLMPRKAST